jgi:GT2 family glycosyltransferase
MSEPAAELTPISARGKFLHDAAGKWFAQGVTYGPFPPGTDQLQLPAPEIVARDFAQMRELGVNLVRVYHPPPRWLLDSAAANGLRVLAGIPWAQHADTLRSSRIRREIERTLRAAVAASAGHPAMLGWLAGSEMASNVVRWLGAKKVRVFLDCLIDAIHEEDPSALASYASFPPTEYLIPAAADFLTFNVFLERRADYARYLARLHNLADGRPLIIGEFGLDTLRHGEERQAETLAWHHDETIRSGAAGAILFSWTDEWFNGGQLVDDWRFGLVTADRRPKAACAVLRPLLTKGPSPEAHAPLPRVPPVSVIVCAYNAAGTLPGCLRALDALRYEDFEIILVDDGSTDGTPACIAAWVEERARDHHDERPVQHIVHQENLGLSAARNTGAKAAAGEVLAYTDADCEPDVDWLYHLVSALLSGEFAGVGGPNLPPPATSLVPAAVAASPGGPSHVLLTDSVAEHVPGCNMAFWRWAFDAAGGFDAAFRRAGDDVDFCWRVQANGGVIAFAPGAVVWHHRRFTVRCFLRQQCGYGEAEALLRFKHPILFTAIGSAKWRGVIYGAPRLSWWFSHPVVYHGALGQGLFQSLYPAPSSPVAAYLGSVEWLALAIIVALFSIPLPWLRVVPVMMLLGSIAVALSWMSSTHLDARHESLRARLLVAWLAFLQPLVRGWARWRARLIPPATKPEVIQASDDKPGRLVFWSEKGVGRDALLPNLLHALTDSGWRYTVDPGWRRWDVQIHGGHWWNVLVRTVTDDHGRGKCLTRVSLVPQPTLPMALLFSVLLCLPLAELFFKSHRFPWTAAVVGGVLLAYAIVALRVRRRLSGLVTRVAKESELGPVR